MVGLLDIAPVAEKVTVRGRQLPVYGVSAKGLAYLIGRFPEIRQMMVGKSIDASRLLAIGGDAVEAIIAAGLGFPGDEDQERAAGTLALEEQADILSAILRLTLPNGIGPFAQQLAALGGILNGEGPSPKAPASNSPKRSTN